MSALDTLEGLADKASNLFSSQQSEQKSPGMVSQMADRAFYSMMGKHNPFASEEELNQKDQRERAKVDKLVGGSSSKSNQPSL